MTATRTIPGPAPVNNLIGLLRLMPRIKNEALQLMSEYTAQYGSFFQVEVAKQRQIILSHPTPIREVLVTQADKFIKDPGYTDTRRGLARFFGNGLLTSNGDFWKRQRKLASPALHTRRINAYADTMVDYTAAQLDTWHNGETIDLSKKMSELTLKIVAKTLFSTTVADDVQLINDDVNVIQEWSSISQFAITPTWVPTPMELRARKAGRELNEVVYRMIAERRKNPVDNGDLMSMLMLAEDEDGNHMNDVQLRDEVVTLMLAGHETTANTLNWTFMLLAQHPEIEAKLHAELDSVLAGRAPTLEDLKALRYTDLVIREAMRLYPPAWAISREATDDVEIDGTMIPKGTGVMILAYHVHRNPEFWDQPDAFIPERFSPENEGKINKYAYIPFGGGPRVCIGQSFAMMEAVLLLATIAQRYQLRMLPGHKVEMVSAITLYPKNGLPMTLKRREPVYETASPMPQMA